MYEIKYNDQDVFRDLIADQKIHRNGEYDFTYENRFILYHVRKYGKLHYVAYDLLTDREYSITTTKKDAYLENTYTRLIPLIIERTRSHTTRDCTRMMNIRIFQINNDRDLHGVKFTDYDFTARYQGSEDIDASIYDEVFAGPVDCKHPEDVYQMFNTEGHPLHRGHS